MTSTSPAEVAAWCETIKPSVIAVDAPSGWSMDDHCRSAERSLMGAGIWCFSTKTRRHAVGHPRGYYNWVLNGEMLYEALEALGCIRYRGIKSKRKAATVIETFPHAAACGFSNTLLAARNKRRDRQKILENRISLGTLPLQIDYLDAAMCALVARDFLTGEVREFGDPEGGFIVTPTWTGRLQALV